MAKRKKSKKKYWWLVLLPIVGVGGYLLLNHPEAMQDVKEKIEKPKLKIINESSKERPIAIMLNNHAQARKNHAGLDDAYIVYEAIVEGGLTRIMAIYKDQESNRIGSVRSARPYFLDYALENDAIYVHYGWSPEAQSDIKKLKIQNINGLYDNAFFRDTSLNVAYEHTAYTTMEKIKAFAKKKNYRMTTNEETLLHYDTSEINLEGISASTVQIPYSKYVTTSYTYDSNQKVYLRFVNEEIHKDAITQKQYTTKNIIIQMVNDQTIDSYGRKSLDNIGTGKGYYITNGNAISIEWKKSSRNEKTIYQYVSEDGTIHTLKVNDGNTYIQIVPTDEDVIIS